MKPNILFILSDDQGAWAMRCAGNTDVITPNLDALAEQGMRFENFFCASPVCSPARASILTGTIPSAHGVLDWLRGGNLDMDEHPHLKDNPVFASEHGRIRYLDGLTAYTDLLAQNGYRCGLSGKWHMGDSMSPQHGFTDWMTIGRGGCDYFAPDVVRDGKLAVENRYITDIITDDAIENLKRYAQEDTPFYLSVHYTAPHSPWDEKNHPREYLDLYRDCAFTATPDLPIHPWQAPTAPQGTGEKRKEHLRGYYAAITAMDAGIGRILDTLRQTGQAENTLIIFTGDNGMNMGHHGIWGKGNGTFPQNLFDTSVKVPFIAVWPGQIPQGTVCGEMVSHYDLLPTFAQWFALSGEVVQPLPGRSFVDLLTGKDTARGREAVVIYDEYGPCRMIRTREWKYIHRYPYGPHELYHLAEDPGEEENLYGKPGSEAVTQELRAMLADWFLRFADPRIDGSREPVTGMGQLRRVGVHAQGKPAHAQIEEYYRDR